MLSPDGSLELSSTLGGLLMGFAGAEGTKGWSESHRVASGAVLESQRERRAAFPRSSRNLPSGTV